MGKTEHLSFRVPPELKSELKKLADADRRELVRDHRALQWASLGQHVVLSPGRRG